MYLAAAIMMVACTSKVPENGALIQGQATGLDPNDVITAMLFQQEGGMGVEIQTDTLKNGRFSFQLDSLAEADYYMIMLTRPRQNFEEIINFGPDVYLEPGAFVRIKGEGKHFRTARIDSPVKDQKLRQQFLNKMSREDWDALDDSQAEYYRIIYEIQFDESLTREQKDSLRVVAQQCLKTSDEINARLSQQEIKILETEEIGAFALHRINSLAHQVSIGKKAIREDVLRLYERLSDEQKATRDGMETLNFLNPVKTVSAGSPIPSYDYVDKDGNSVHTSDFSGKWILMDFWSYGCGPCIKAIPELGEVSKDFQEQLAVVSINLDTDRLWREASKEHGIFWNDWNDPKGSAGSIRAFGSTGIPTFVLVSPEGVIADITTGYSKGLLRSKVQKVMGL